MSQKHFLMLTSCRFRPQDVGLTIWANLKDAAGDMHRLIAYNSTVTVVEPAASIFDIKL
jgi:translocon-associated protein subunit alpha